MPRLPGVVGLLLVGLVIGACAPPGASAPAGASAPGSPPIGPGVPASPTPVAPGSSAPSAASPAGVLELRVSTSTPLAPGTYTRSAFSPAVTFAVDGPWYAVQQAPGFFDVQQDVGSPHVIALQFANVTGVAGATGETVALASASDALGLLHANDRLTVLGSSESRIDGREGVVIEVENGGLGDTPVLVVPAGPLAISPERRLWVGLFDTSNGVLGVLVGGSVDQWDRALAIAEPVLESVRIAD